MNESENTENVQHSAQNRTTPSTAQPGRNTPCPCKSGLKYKRCCLNRSADRPSQAMANAG
jgi:uncharacterized protein YecA (UPF0149 family)